MLVQPLRGFTVGIETDSSLALAEFLRTLLRQRSLAAHGGKVSDLAATGWRDLAGAGNQGLTPNAVRQIRNDSRDSVITQGLTPNAYVVRQIRNDFDAIPARSKGRSSYIRSDILNL